MKPNFAFTLSYQGIGLLQRAFPGWKTVGEVAFDSPDLSGELAKLRQKANDLDASGVRSKLVIPNDQIKFLTIPTNGSDQSNIEQRVQEALIGATPYEVTDLAFDYSIDDEIIYIAAVARDTLAEAEGFATEHAFNSICFVAIPETGAFSGEPFFGATQYALSIMPEGGQVLRDFAPITVMAKALVTAPNPEPLSDGFPNHSETIEIGEEASQDTLDSHSNTAGEDIDAPSISEIAEQDSLDTLGADNVDSVAIEPETDAEKEIVEDPAPIAAFSSIRTRPDDIGNGAPRLDGVERGGNTPTSEDVPTAPSIPFPADDDIAAPSAPLARRHTAVPDIEFEENSHDFHADSPERETTAEPNSAVAALSNAGAVAAGAVGSAGAFISRRLPKLGRDAPQSRTVKPAQASSNADRFPAPVDEKQRMTVFGERKSEPVGGKPRFLGLILLTVLLLFLAGVAAWASIFLDEGLASLFSPRNKETAIASGPTPLDGEALTNELAVEGDEASPQSPILASLPTGERGASFEPALSSPIQIDPAQAIAEYAVTGIWQLAPEQPNDPQGDGLETLYITSIDPAVSKADAVALPAARNALTDLQLRRQISPVAPEIKFEFDSRGLIIATTQGSLTPDGITIFRGRPPVSPPNPPERVVKDPVKEAQTLRFAKLRPQSRPNNLVEQNERSTLGGRTRVEMARLRPTARPRVAETKQVEEADETATDQAVVASRKPNARPRNFALIVKRAQQQQKETITTVAAVAPRTVTPKVPSNAGVARLATTRKAINLKRTNLIGVYGKPSSRRALVRLSNGRYKKVKVGDRIDGGRISAIGESDLRYTKGGRNVVLKMPRG